MKSILPISIWPGSMINAFLIKGENQHILVDTGVPGSEHKILNQLEKRNIDKNKIGLIIVTHAHIDHFGSAARLKKILNIPILVHKLDEAAYCSGKADKSTMKVNKPQWKLFKLLVQNQETSKFKPDIIIEGDATYDLERWGIKGKVIHTPGHTPGSLSIILDNNAAIIMDMMASGILLGGLMFHSRIKHPLFHDDLKALKSSFKKVLSEKGEQFYLGHGKPVNRKQVLKYYHSL
ncbi:MAG: MBL fold metallo-hydrolase [Flammeovirgaceae bacterium]|nr:MBL fold metallo-hydrolase [Flammeovirgaceae bacterium]